MAGTKEKDERIIKWTIGEQRIKKWMSDEQELFVAVLKGNREIIQEKLLAYVFDGEYIFRHDGGEPDMEYILAVKLLECMSISKFGMSIIYSDVYLEHVFKREKGDVKG